MEYETEFKPLAWKDLDRIPVKDALRIHERIDRLRHHLTGDVKRLHNFDPSYRLRVGNYRVLFEIEGGKLTIYRIKHRREAYD